MSTSTRNTRGTGQAFGAGCRAKSVPSWWASARGRLTNPRLTTSELLRSESTLRSVQRWIMLESLMRRSRHLRSRLPLLLALLAWTALSFEAIAHPLAMAGEAAAKAPMAMGTSAASHCDGMSMANATHARHASHPGPSHPTPDNQGCCAGHSCFCSSLLSGMAVVSSLGLIWQPTHGSVQLPVRLPLALTRAAPPLRPPIT